MFIIVTNHLQRAIRVNVDHIADYREDTSGTSVMLSDGSGFVVQETVKELDRALNEGFIYVRQVKD